MDMSLLNESIVPFTISRDVLCNDNTRWSDFYFSFDVFYDKYYKHFVLKEKACVSEACWCSILC